ncbi:MULTISPECIES: hypothetical protein [Streptomyces]|jgi:hypothetical protein|uniref:Uncharacterized protein n=1 Tax=Streptomyces peucetius TaxID=1950 RepID=A0ABY6IBM3_STRPE|nr:hypothetical protein [Streptomyces peucetius]UYQ63115.1 hypothetical protein OGH68_17590 [Streptomyces peucetius]
MNDIELAAGFDTYADVNEMADEVTPDEAPSPQTIVSLSVVASIKWGC